MVIRGTLPVLPTPFHEGAVDHASLERLVEHTLPYVDGYTVLGSTGEAPSLTFKERTDLVELVVRLVPPEKTIVVGVAHTSAAEAAQLARHAQAHGAQGVLIPVPYYFPNTPEGALSFLAEVDRVLDIDLVLYDNPVTTKTTLQSQTVIAWAQRLHQLHTVKLTDHDVTKIADWQRAGLGVLAGDDVILFRYLAAGVDGSMVLAPILFPDAFNACWECLGQGKVAAAFAIFTGEILPFLHVFGLGDEIATTKAMLSARGLIASAELRAPLTEADPARQILLDIAYEQCRARTVRRQTGR